MVAGSQPTRPQDRIGYVLFTFTVIFRTNTNRYLGSQRVQEERVRPRVLSLRKWNLSGPETKYPNLDWSGACMSERGIFASVSIYPWSFV
jgi:hypothetical protein